MARIFLVDDHAIMRDGVAAILERSSVDDVVGDQTGLEDLDARLRELRVDVLLLDISLEKGTSLQEIARLKAAHPELLIIILSMHEEASIVERAMQAGADGYTLKRDAFDDIVYAIRAAERGGRFISPSVIGGENVSITIDKPPAEELPERQKQILRLVADGKSNKQIAGILEIALPTVKNHLAVLYRKFGATNRVDLLNKLDLTDLV